jgi:hypothetical protein
MLDSLKNIRGIFRLKPVLFFSSSVLFNLNITEIVKIEVKFMDKAEIIEPKLEKNENKTIDIAEIVRLAIKASKEYDAKQKAKNKKARYEWKLRNTRLLLNHYNYFKDHIDESIYSSDHLKTIDILAEIEDCRSSIDIRAIKKSAQKTFVIMAHIDSMIDLYQSVCDRAGETEQRKLRVLKMFFFEKLIVADILKVESISESTFYRDIDSAVDKLSSLIFGIDAFDKMTET